MLLGRGFEEDMAAPAPKTKSKRKLILAIIAIAIIAVVITPIALAGSYRVPLEIMSFDDTTGTTTTSPSLTKFTNQLRPARFKKSSRGSINLTPRHKIGQWNSNQPIQSESSPAGH